MLFIVAGDVISILANNGVKGVLIFGGIIMTEKRKEKEFRLVIIEIDLSEIVMIYFQIFYGKIGGCYLLLLIRPG